MVDRAYYALCEADRFQQTRQIRNVAVAAAAFAREAKDRRLLDKATELRTRAERKAGQMLDQARRDGELRAGNPQLSSTPTIGLSQIGVTRDQSSKWQEVAKLTDDEFEEALETTKAITHEISTPKVLQAARRAKQREPVVIDAEDDDADVVAELPAPAAPSHDEQAVAFYNAVRALAGITCTPAELRAALPYYQHFRIAEGIGRALQLLQEVNAKWPKN